MCSKIACLKLAILRKYFCASHCQIDILVNNAGRSQRASAVETKLEVDRAVLEINTFGTLSLTKAVLPHLVEQKEGYIVVISSVAGKLGMC